MGINAYQAVAFEIAAFYAFLFFELDFSKSSSLHATQNLIQSNEVAIVLSKTSMPARDDVLQRREHISFWT